MAGDAGHVDGADGPVDLGTAPVPTGTPAVLRTTCATHPCLVCWLVKAMEESGDVPGYKLATEPLHINIVGGRQETSITDAFDDSMVLLCRLLPGDQRVEYEKAVEAEIRDRLHELDHSRARLVACTKPETRGLWVVAVYEHVTTDPGLEARRDDVYGKKVRAAQAALARNDQAVSDLTVQIDAARARLTEAEGPRARRRAAARVRKLERRKQNLERKRGRLQKRLEWREAQEEKRLKSRDEKRAGKEIRLQDGSKPGWLAQGRALVSPGVHAGRYRYRLHKGLKGHVALGVGRIYYARRVYSAGGIRRRFDSWVKDDARRRKKKEKPHFQWEEGAVSVAEVVPFGGEEQEYPQGTARVLVREKTETTEKGRKRRVKETVLLTATADGVSETLLDDRDVVVVRARVSGTNIHRAHKTRLQDGKVVSSLRGDLSDDRVKNWSEGCQTYRSPDEFAEFLRLCAVSHRWRCTRQDAARVGDSGCEIVAPSAKGAPEPSPGERALEDAYGPKEVSVRAAAPYRKLAAKQGPKVRRLRSRASDLETRLERLRGRWIALEEKKAGVLGWGSDDEVASAELGAQIDAVEGDLESTEAALASAKPEYHRNKDVADQLEGDGAEREELRNLEADDRNRLSIAWAEKKATSARSALGRARKAKARSRAERALKRREALVTARTRRATELRGRAGLSPELEEIRRDFLRQRAAFYGADHLRICQVKWDGCPVRFDYVLIELPTEDREWLVGEALEDRRYRTWDGELALAAPGPAPTSVGP